MRSELTVLTKRGVHQRAAASVPVVGGRGNGAGCYLNLEVASPIHKHAWSRIAFLVACFVITDLAQAATNVWSGAGSDNTWTNAGNWFGTYAAANVNQFTNVTTTINFRVSASTAGILLSDAASNVTVTNAGTTMTLSGGYGLNLRGSTLTLSPRFVTLGAAQTWTIASGAALTVSSNINKSSFLLTINNDGAAAINGIISGTGGLTKSGTGTLTLSGLNSYNGNTIVNGGTLRVSGTIDGGGTVTVASGATLDVEHANVTSGKAWNISGTVSSGSGFYQTLGNLTLNGGTLTGTGAGNNTYGFYRIIAPGSVTATGNSQINAPDDFSFSGNGIVVTFNVVNASDTLTIASRIINPSGSAGLTKTGSGLLTLNAANTYTGSTTISAGTLALGASGLLASASSVSIAAGATFDVSARGASATYTLGSGATLTAGGTGTVLGTSAAAIKGGASGSVSLLSRPITLTYDGSHPALYISQGRLVLNSNAFTVNSPAPLAPGTYAIIQQASGNVSSSGTFTVSGTALGGNTGSIQVSGGNVNLVIAGQPPQLVITAVNGGVNPIAGTAFSVVVQVQQPNGTPQNVVANTTVTLSLATGTGTLGGTLTGTILAGNNSVTISGVTYTKAESGVVLTATRSSGDTLPAGDSPAFTVNADVAATLALTSGDNQGGAALTALASPFVVTVTDAYGNPVRLTSVTFALGSAPGGATGQALSTTATTTDVNGQASSTLTLGSAAGTYTVTATATGLSGSPVTFTANATARLAITSVNSGVNPNAGAGFSVVVQAQDASGTSQNVTANTAVTLSRTAGTGTLGGTLIGTILAGNNSVTISGVTYTKAESGVVLTATRTSGDTLSAGSSAPFTVNPGAPAVMALTSGNSQQGAVLTALTSPFVVTVTDANGNTVSGTTVTFAIATVPGGATGQSLNPTSTTTAPNGQAPSTLTLGSTAGTYTVTATSAGLSGSPVTFTASVVTGAYTPVAAATYEYQICLKCHSGYAWLPGSPPNGLSPNGTALKPVETDQAQEFSPMNKSGHPIVTGLDNYPNSLVVGGKKGLLAAAMKAPWNVNVGQQTMSCTDCHNTDAAAPAAQGPHGSAAQFILRGPNANNWPNVQNTAFSTSWCANCHNNTSTSVIHGDHHNNNRCYECHIVVPHGGKISRLLGANGGGLPARYAYNNTTTTMRMTGVTKSTATGYSQSTCGGCGEHTSGTEKW